MSEGGVYGTLPSRSQCCTARMGSLFDSGRGTRDHREEGSLLTGMPVFERAAAPLPFVVYEGTKEGRFSPERISLSNFGFFSGASLLSLRKSRFRARSTVGTFLNTKQSSSSSILFESDLTEIDPFFGILLFFSILVDRAPVGDCMRDCFVVMRAVHSTQKFRNPLRLKQTPLLPQTEHTICNSYHHEEQPDHQLHSHTHRIPLTPEHGQGVVHGGRHDPLVHIILRISLGNGQQGFM